jgi:hypothetical protein
VLRFCNVQVRWQTKPIERRSIYVPSKSMPQVPAVPLMSSVYMWLFALCVWMCDLVNRWQAHQAV